MVCAFDHDSTEEQWALAYRWDIVLRGEQATPWRSRRMTTPSQTVGPYLAIGLPWPDGPDVVPEGTPGRHPDPRAACFDGAGEPMPDALIETWQADPDGRFGTGFRGFGRCADQRRRRVGDPHASSRARSGDGQAPHIDVTVFARGLLNRCVTRIYFADEDNAADPVLASRARGAARDAVAEPGDDGYRFDIHLQGERETVFFSV